MYNYSLETTKELLEFIIKQSEFIIESTAHITDVEQFLQTTIGMVYYNSSCMCIQTIGESLQKVDKFTDGKLRENNPDIPWKEIIGMRQYISHEYGGIDPETVFSTIKDDIPLLIPMMKRLLESLNTL